VKLSPEQRATELQNVHTLVQAVLDYHLESLGFKLKTEGFDSDGHFRKLKIEAELHFRKGRLTKLKQWFRDLSEMFVDDSDFKAYLNLKAGITIDLKDDFEQRVARVEKRGSIRSNNEHREIEEMVSLLSQSNEPDTGRINRLNELLLDFHENEVV
jgi:hypothetical protein